MRAGQASLSVSTLLLLWATNSANSQNCPKLAHACSQLLQDP
jgi:hypothetical protein